jgi:hypothetical protein
MTSSLFVLAALAALDLARKAVDRLARWRHWRVGRWGKLLCIWQRVGETCLHCRTDYRYVLGHPIRYTGETRETARAIVPLCQRCWLETPPPGRLAAAAAILNEWRHAGVYGDGDTFDQAAWDDHRLEVYTAVKGGL